MTREVREWTKKPIQMVMVWWSDSATHGDESLFSTSSTFGVVTGVSVGHLVKEEPEYIVLAMDYWEDGSYRGAQSISRRSIDKVRYIKL